MTRVMRKIEFDAGHRVLGHEGKCANLHGHRYVAEVVIEAPSLDNLGRVVDFGCIKSVIGSWVDKYWDHNTILHPEDPFLLEAPRQSIEDPQHYLRRLFGRDPFVMPADLGNPTAENMAEFLAQKGNYLLQLYCEGKDISIPICVYKVRIWETPNCYAEYKREAGLRVNRP